MPAVVKSRQETFADDIIISTALSVLSEDDNLKAESYVPITRTSNLLGRQFLLDTPEDVQHLSMDVVKALDSHQDDLNYNPSLKEFIFASKEENVEQIMGCNEILGCVQNQYDEDQIIWFFKSVASHEVPFTRNYTNCNGQLYNLITQYKNEEITSDPSSSISSDDHVNCALHAKYYDLLENPR